MELNMDILDCIKCLNRRGYDVSRAGLNFKVCMGAMTQYMNAKELEDLALNRRTFILWLIGFGGACLLLLFLVCWLLPAKGVEMHTMSDKNMIEYKAQIEDALFRDLTHNELEMARRDFLNGLMPCESADHIEYGIIPDRFYNQRGYSENV